jgi:iduronate 2-sulfatase
MLFLASKMSLCALVIIPISTTASAVQPNVLFIVVDDLRTELGCYGNNEIITPNIDRLASEGALFERAYCQVPVCGASRASFMTGLYPTPERFVRYYARADEDAPGIVDIPGWFQSKGYTTISNGKIYHHQEDNADSWDEIFRPQDFRVYLLPENQGKPFNEQVAWEAADVCDDAYPSGKLANKVIEDLRRAKTEGTPFFIAAGFTKPHLPFNAPKKYWDMYDAAAIELADNPYQPAGAPKQAMHEWNELRDGYGGMPKTGPLPDELARILIHGYHASTTYTDAMVGRVMDALKELEMTDHTIVVLMGDHGWQLGEHSLWCKHANFNTSLQTPLIISAPGIPSGQRVEGLVEFVDIYPTLCELSGLESPDHLQGDSLVALLENPVNAADFAKTAVFSRYHSGDSVKVDRFLYTEWKSGARMLYDHEKDPDENVNISENPENQRIVEKMQELLDAHSKNL